jgi:hypothetical protein
VAAQWLAVSEACYFGSERGEALRGCDRDRWIGVEYPERRLAGWEASASPATSAGERGAAP